jgi:hypothetical protein
MDSGFQKLFHADQRHGKTPKVFASARHFRLDTLEAGVRIYRRRIRPGSPHRNLPFSASLERETETEAISIR